MKLTPQQALSCATILLLVATCSLLVEGQVEECTYECSVSYCEYSEDYCDYDCYEVCYPAYYSANNKDTRAKNIGTIRQTAPARSEVKQPNRSLGANTKSSQFLSRQRPLSSPSTSSESMPPMHRTGKMVHAKIKPATGLRAFTISSPSSVDS